MNTDDLRERRERDTQHERTAAMVDNGALERYLTVDDVANMIGVSPKTVYGWVYAQRIPHVKFSRSVLRFRRSDIDAWAESNTTCVGGRQTEP